MSFELLFKSGTENSEDGLSAEDVVKKVKDKINEKKQGSEAGTYFNQKDQQNLQSLESYPESDLKRIFKYSRELMIEVKKNPQIVDNRVRLFRQKVG